jgi:hypothetical protein
MADPIHDGLTDEQNRIALEWLNKHWKNRACPICGDNNWTVHRYLMTPSVFTRQNALNFGQTTPMLMISSDKCGYTFYISAIIAGVIKSEPSK